MSPRRGIFHNQPHANVLSSPRDHSWHPGPSRWVCILWVWTVMTGVTPGCPPVFMALKVPRHRLSLCPEALAAGLPLLCAQLSFPRVPGP